MRNSTSLIHPRDLLAYEEGKVEVKFADELLTAWAYLSRDSSLAPARYKCSLAGLYRPKADSMSETTARVLQLELTLDQFDRVDGAVCLLAAPLGRSVFMAYLNGVPEREAARRLHISANEHHYRLIAARWAVHHILLPDVEKWRRSAWG